MLSIRVRESPFRLARRAAFAFLCCVVPSQAAPAASSESSLRVVTYNVAGLPEGISGSHPTRYLPLIGAKLNRFDLALVQEDFAYATLLRQSLTLPYASPPFERGERYDFGDGLSQFGRAAFGELERVPWTHCHGITGAFFDCLTPKGFSYARVWLAPTESIDVYNLHMDAGDSADDRAAREAQLEQLAQAVSVRSARRAVLIGGDFNLDATETATLRAFERIAQVRDACAALACPEPGRIDRILFRGSDSLAIAPQTWRVDRSFVDEQGRALSDHAPVVVSFSLRVASREQASK